MSPDTTRRRVVLPTAPSTLAESGLAFDTLLQMITKILHLAGERSGADLASRLGLRYAVIEPVLQHLRSTHLCEVFGGAFVGGPSFTYRITDAGRTRAMLYLEQSHYVGVAPVPFRQYEQYMRQFDQQVERTVTRARVQQGFSHLVLSDRVLDQLGPAVNSGHSLFVYGPPGNGKTTLAEGIAESLAVPLIVPRYELLIGSYLGETAARLARVVEYARSRACVLFFDEFDTLGKERGDQHETGEIKRVVSSLLLQMDSLPSYVVLIAATNHAELLDRAAWRRFQLRLELAAPTKAQRVEWLTRFATSRGINWGIAPPKIAERLSATSFAELEQFGLDVLRQHVLSLPDSDIGRIVETRLQQWKLRQAVKDAAHDSEVAD